MDFLKWKTENVKATVKWKIGFLRLENENSTPYCPPSLNLDQTESFGQGKHFPKQIWLKGHLI